MSGMSLEGHRGYARIQYVFSEWHLTSAFSRCNYIGSARQLNRSVPALPEKVSEMYILIQKGFIDQEKDSRLGRHGELSSERGMLC
jgi:hypothetical protein